MCCVHAMCNEHTKFLPWGVACVFTKREETFSGKVSSEISGENVATFFPGSFPVKFPMKVSRHKLCKSLIYRLQSIIPLYVVSTVVVKFCGENFPTGEFREIRETSRRENFPPGFPPGFSGIFRKPLCKPM